MMSDLWLKLMTRSDLCRIWIVCGIYNRELHCLITHLWKNNFSNLLSVKVHKQVCNSILRRRSHIVSYIMDGTKFLEFLFLSFIIRVFVSTFFPLYITSIEYRCPFVFGLLRRNKICGSVCIARSLHIKQFVI